MDSHPANHVVMEGQGFIPGADGHAAAATAEPFLFVDCPEGQTAISPNVPFSEAGIVEKRAGGRLCGRSERNGIGRAKDSTAFARHAELVYAE